MLGVLIKVQGHQLLIDSYMFMRGLVSDFNVYLLTNIFISKDQDQLNNPYFNSFQKVGG